MFPIAFKLVRTVVIAPCATELFVLSSVRAPQGSLLRIKLNDEVVLVQCTCWNNHIVMVAHMCPSSIGVHYYMSQACH